MTIDLNTYIREIINKAILELYSIPALDFKVEHPENQAFGDYSSNVSMILSKQLKQSPIEIAKNITYRLLEGIHNFETGGRMLPIFEKIEVAGNGFINFKVSKEWLINLLVFFNDDSQHYGISRKGHGRKIALEHSNVNPNKAAHVGHLRNACIGQFLERAYENLGYDVNVQYYSNDVGVQVATSYLGMNYFQDLDLNKYNKFDHLAWDVYSKIETLIESDETLKAKREQILIDLDNPNSETFKNQRILADKILYSQLQTFGELDFDYDVVIHESDIISHKFWEKTFEILKNNPNFYLCEDGSSKGCWLLRMSKNDICSDSTITEREIEEDKIIVRSNGVPTYTGKDIAYHMWKFGLLNDDFKYEKLSNINFQSKDLFNTNINAQVLSDVSFSNSDIVFDVIDVRQTYAISAVKNALSYLGYTKESENMKHVNYGFVYLSPNTAEKLGIDISDNKSQYAMSGRKGWGIKIDDFIVIMDEKLKKDFGDFPNIREVRNAAIKFEMLKSNIFQDLIFDLDQALNNKGFTGPYIQYAHARANSILEKNSEVELDKHLLFSVSNLDDREVSLLRQLYKFPEVVENSALEFSPNVLCIYLFDLASKFNTFYNSLSVTNAETPSEKVFRLYLTLAVKNILAKGLFILGIKAPDRL